MLAHRYTMAFALSCFCLAGCSVNAPRPPSDAPSPPVQQPARADTAADVSAPAASESSTDESTAALPGPANPSSTAIATGANSAPALTGTSQTGPSQTGPAPAAPMASGKDNADSPDTTQVLPTARIQHFHSEEEALVAATEAMTKGRHHQAAALFNAVLASEPKQSLQQRALTGLILLHLSPNNPDFDVNAAIEVMDRLNLTLTSRSDQQLLFNSLRLLLENTADLSRLKQQTLSQDGEIRALKLRINNLETALERLRKISLQ